MKKCILAALAALTILASCDGGTGGATDAVAFPNVKIPGIIEDPSARLAYATEHFWDAFASDSAYYKSVPEAEVEKQMGMFATLVQEPGANGEKAMTAMFRSFESAPWMYSNMCRLASRYFYDPNSPVRDESLYLPFVTLMAESPLTDDSMRTAYRWDASMCALNAPGTKAADFRFIDTEGRSRTLYSVKADALVLIFGNPDCKACEELMEQMSESPEVNSLLDSGRLKVLDIYIDEDIALWKSRIASYPAGWINGYDPDFVIRQDLLYNVRALPSIYLLGADKSVILKDTTGERLLGELNAGNSH